MSFAAGFAAGVAVERGSTRDAGVTEKTNVTVKRHIEMRYKAYNTQFEGGMG